MDRIWKFFLAIFVSFNDDDDDDNGKKNEWMKRNKGWVKMAMAFWLSLKNRNKKEDNGHCSFYGEKWNEIPYDEKRWWWWKVFYFIRENIKNDTYKAKNDP